jgi:hypothetical protein
MSSTLLALGPDEAVAQPESVITANKAKAHQRQAWVDGWKVDTDSAVLWGFIETTF